MKWRFCCPMVSNDFCVKAIFSSDFFLYGYLVIEFSDQRLKSTRNVWNRSSTAALRRVATFVMRGMAARLFTLAQLTSDQNTPDLSRRNIFIILWTMWAPMWRLPIGNGVTVTYWRDGNKNHCTQCIIFDIPPIWSIYIYFRFNEDCTSELSACA